MKKSTIGAIAILVIGFVFTLTIGIMYVNTSNSEIRLRNQIGTVQVDNQNEFDNMWKKISQVAQVTKAERASVEKIIIGYADQRTSGGSGSFINAVREALPNIDNAAFLNLQNIIVASRDSFTNRQTQLLDLKREHDNLLMTFPGSIFVGGREQIEVTIVTSDRTVETFETGVDNDVSLGLE